MYKLVLSNNFILFFLLEVFMESILNQTISSQMCNQKQNNLQIEFVSSSGMVGKEP